MDVHEFNPQILAAFEPVADWCDLWIHRTLKLQAVEYWKGFHVTSYQRGLSSTAVNLSVSYPTLEEGLQDMMEYSEIDYSTNARVLIAFPKGEPKSIIQPLITRASLERRGIVPTIYVMAFVRLKMPSEFVMNPMFDPEPVEPSSARQRVHTYLPWPTE